MFLYGSFKLMKFLFSKYLFSSVKTLYFSILLLSECHFVFYSLKTIKIIFLQTNLFQLSLLKKIHRYELND